MLASRRFAPCRSTTRILYDHQDEYIRLECARRRNQMSIRRRSSIVEQYSVSVPSSRLKERRAQSRHHAFLLRIDNKAALESITDRVRELAELHSSTTSNSVDQLSPMEKERLLAWTDGVDRLLNDFEPSDNHSFDPIVRMLEKLQFLQDGHVCLAEVAVDARALLERWDHDGLFDTSGSSDDDGAAKNGEEEADGDSGAGERSDSIGARQRDKALLQYSHAYDTVRQRAAANMIKRSILRWARAQESFRDRVDEIQLFGKTTSSLMKELMSIANERRPTLTAPSDIFVLVKVKQSGVYAHSIGFSDLMQFSKHVGLFSVDQAIRTVEELDRKRFLFMARCALKVQTLWRSVRKEFQARRMRKLVEELRQQREKQGKEERERLLLSAAHKQELNLSEGKHKSVLSPAKKSRAVSVSTPLSTDASRATSRGSDQSSTPQSGRLRASVVGVVKQKESSSRMKPGGGGGVDSPHEKTRGRQNKVKARSRFDDDDGDTTDVETAWQAFLDSAQVADTSSEMGFVPDGVTAAATHTTYDTEDTAKLPTVAMPDSIDSDWKSWSDDEVTDFQHHGEDDADLDTEEELARKLQSGAATALSPPTASELRNDDVGATHLDGVGATIKSLSLNENQTRSQSNNSETSAGTASSLLNGFQLDDNDDRFRAKKTRVGTVSRMVPFAEFSSSETGRQTNVSSISAEKKPRVQTRQRLDELEFGNADTKLALLQFADPLVSLEAAESAEHSATPLRCDTLIQTVRVRQKESTRKRRVDVIRHAIATRETEIFTYPTKTKRQLHYASSGVSINTAIDNPREREHGVDPEGSSSEPRDLISSSTQSK